MEWREMLLIEVSLPTILLCVKYLMWLNHICYTEAAKHWKTSYITVRTKDRILISALTELDHVHTKCVTSVIHRTRIASSARMDRFDCGLRQMKGLWLLEIYRKNQPLDVSREVIAVTCLTENWNLDHFFNLGVEKKQENPHKTRIITLFHVGKYTNDDLPSKRGTCNTLYTFYSQWKNEQKSEKMLRIINFNHM